MLPDNRRGHAQDAAAVVGRREVWRRIYSACVAGSKSVSAKVNSIEHSSCTEGAFGGLNNSATASWIS
jgi:hypothetical protein